LDAENFSIPLGKEGHIAGSSYGQGQRLILCFHGYGQSRKLFLPILPWLPADARIVLLDLPLFGASAWPEGQGPIQPKDLGAFLAALLERFPADVIEVLAFSLGAKIALGMYQATDLPIQRMVLISPDGLRIHPLYRFCIYNPIGKVLFYTVLKWPTLFLAALKVLYRLRITDPFKYRFVSRQFDAPHKRKLLRRTWQENAAIRPDLDVIATKSASTGTAWHVIWGADDDVLPMKLCRDFIQKVNHAKLHTVAGGHFLLNPPHPALASIFQSIFNS
jgi:pimeloyl-ACP methyl ester carboxylesterase